MMLFNILMKAAPGSVYNIGSGIEKTNIDVIELDTIEEQHQNHIQASEQKG